jgi:DNA topoisomerase-1
VAVHDGQYGPYVKHGNVSASIPKGTNPTDVTLAQAVELLDEKRGRAPRAAKALRKPRAIKRTRPSRKA